MEQLILHLLGDYVTQTPWIVRNKTKRMDAAAMHALAYSLLFLILSPSFVAFMVIFLTHALIDRYRLARYVVYAKTRFSDAALRWDEVIRYGPAKETASSGIWFLMIVDNTMHLTINYAALRWL